ncbi:DUF397 domain-containing protein [Streptomyces sp. GS7]|uniref:DUF397 domain-containing protein n=1 Tax=Streptomyces sp. GS7 TaxID=2692234 RepID=UPI001317490E|nr:DUF397 domain-containing protein [Streptomyces sp. GS7]QHC20908.1 DUF397 domain-containing protein [Streptomyces sp. GS7]
MTLTEAVWEKSSYSGSSGGQCIEFSRAFAPSGLIPVRDSKVPSGPALIFPVSQWSAFIESVKDDAFTA